MSTETRNFVCSNYEEFIKIPFEHRSAKSKQIMEKNPGKIPIIIEFDKTMVPINSEEPLKFKYIVPMDLDMGRVRLVISKKLKLDPIQAMFIFVNKTLVTPTDLLSQIYENHKAKDGFLYITVTPENTFG